LRISGKALNILRELTRVPHHKSCFPVAQDETAARRGRSQ
jgi:hypothetical protein